MPSSSLSVVVQHLRSAAGRDGGGRTDGELLTHFLSQGDEDALAALVERHAPMVWGVCCRILRNPHDAEDAFQATFLVLVQKAATVVPREMVANWLHGVARQTAVRLRATAAKRGWREVQMDVMPEPAVVEARDEELLSRLDEELGRLPERFRALIVLCDLEGHTRKEVARQLGCPEGTVASGLVRARELLAKRLTRRGLAVSGGSLAATLSHSMASTDVPASVVTSAIKVATLVVAGKAAGVISGPVAALTQGVLKTMFLKKILTTTLAVLALGVAVITCGSLAVGLTDGKPAVGKDVKAPVAEKPAEPGPRVPVPKVGPEKKDQEQIQGLWQAESLEAQGVKATNAEAAKFRLRFHGDKITFVADDRTHAFELGPDAKPKTMNLIPGDGEAKGKKLECAIYELDGDTLKICMDKEGESGKRPTEFKTAPGDGFALMVFKRVKEEKKEDQKQEGVIAWGKESGGLQAGLGLLPGAKRVYQHGETVTLVVRVRNVGKQTVTFEYVKQFLDENRPTVTDAEGKNLAQSKTDMLGTHGPTDVTLEPGKEIVLETRTHGASGSRHALLPEGGGLHVSKAWPLFVGTGKFSVHYDAVFGDSSSGKIKLDPALAKLATGKLKLEVNEPKAVPPEKEAFTAWGQEVGGLQAGLGYLPGKKRAYRHRESFALVVRVRNVGNEVVKFQYLKQFLDETPLVVTDADGRPVAQGGGALVEGVAHVPVDVTLKPGAEVVLESRLHGASGVPFELTPPSGVGTKTAHQKLVAGTGKFGLRYDQVLGNSSSGTVTLDPALSKLATGNLELDVKEPEAVPPEKEASTAWGQEVGGLQAGVTVVPGGERLYQPGDRVVFEVKVRNVGKEAVTITYSGVPQEHPPTITDSQGRQVRVTMPPFLGYYAPATKRVLKPDETRTLVKNVVAVEAEVLEKTIGPEGVVSTPTIRVGSGKYKLAVVGLVQSHTKLSTGSVEFVVKPATDAPASPKPDVRKVYTPDELMREKYDAKTTRTVAFKVVALGKPTEVKQSLEKDSPWVIGHGPDDVSLLPQPPKKFQEEQFTAILASKAVDQLKRLGIKDVGKHFEGKTVRLSGRIRQHNYSGDDPPVGPHYHLVVEDVGQIEAVE